MITHINYLARHAVCGDQVHIHRDSNHQYLPAYHRNLTNASTYRLIREVNRLATIGCGCITASQVGWHYTTHEYRRSSNA